MIIVNHIVGILIASIICAFCIFGFLSVLMNFIGWLAGSDYEVRETKKFMNKNEKQQA